MAIFIRTLTTLADLRPPLQRHLRLLANTLRDYVFIYMCTTALSLFLTFFPSLFSQHK